MHPKIVELISENTINYSTKELQMNYLIKQVLASVMNSCIILKKWDAHELRNNRKTKSIIQPYLDEDEVDVNEIKLHSNLTKI